MSRDLFARKKVHVKTTKKHSTKLEDSNAVVLIFCSVDLQVSRESLRAERKRENDLSEKSIHVEENIRIIVCIDTDIHRLFLMFRSVVTHVNENRAMCL